MSVIQEAATPAAAAKADSSEEDSSDEESDEDEKPAKAAPAAAAAAAESSEEESSDDDSDEDEVCFLLSSALHCTQHGYRIIPKHYATAAFVAVSSWPVAQQMCRAECY